MNRIIDFSFAHQRSVLFIWLISLILGVYAYFNIAKESAPDVPIPTIVVSVAHPGISTEDSERLLLKPLQKELKSLDGLKEMKGEAKDNSASVKLEFETGYAIDKGLIEVREKVSTAKAEFPEDTQEPRVREINIALFPVISIALAGDVPYRTLLNTGKELQKKIESVKGVLSAKLSGDLEEQMEVLLSPAIMESYQLSLLDIQNFLDKNHQLVTAGRMEEDESLFSLKVPGLIGSKEEALNMPLKVEGTTVLTFKDLAKVRRNFKSPESLANFNGKPVIIIDVSKRIGANILEVIRSVKEIVRQADGSFPPGLTVSYMIDESSVIKNRLSDLKNNILMAVFLVMIVIIAFLGIRAGLLIGIAIPSTIMAGVFLLYVLGVTLNIVVLFSLIMVIGLLVDGAIVIIEKAERNLEKGLSVVIAYKAASKRMFWPIVSATMTTVAVFFPLLFWPGITGGFMKYLPLTMIITLLISLLIALIVLPILGVVLRPTGCIDKKSSVKPKKSWLLRRYLKRLDALLERPKSVVFAAIILFFLSYFIFIMFGKGVSFFPDVDSNYIQVQVLSRGNLSIYEKVHIIKDVNKRLKAISGIKNVYIEAFSDDRRRSHMAEDTIGRVQIELSTWLTRPKSTVMVEKVRTALAEIHGVKFLVNPKKAGPRADKPIEVVLISNNKAFLKKSNDKILALMSKLAIFRDIESTNLQSGIDWYLNINREEASRYGADVSLLGAMVQMMGQGVKLSEYQPDDSEDEIDIRLRFTPDYRSFSQLKNLKVPTNNGSVPASHFIEVNYQPKVGKILNRQNLPAISIRADVQKGVVVGKAINKLEKAIQAERFPTGVNIEFKGDDERMKEASHFLMKAFVAALFLMTLILLTQFNSFYQTLVTLSAIIFSTTGVLLGLFFTNNPFGIVMVGLGLIALAGIVVNNNIVLIDTFNRNRQKGMASKEAILKTARERMRPVLLTSGTTILGLLPMVFSLTVDLLGRQIYVGAPSSQWWVELSSSIAGGLFFATIMTLFVTPCLLMIAENAKKGA